VAGGNMAGMRDGGDGGRPPVGGVDPYDDGLGPLGVGEAHGASAYYRPPAIRPLGVTGYDAPLYLEDSRCLMEARQWRMWNVVHPGWGGIMFGALKAQFTGAAGGGTSYDKEFIVEVLCSLIRGPILRDGEEEGRQCDMVLRFADKLSLRGKAFPKGLWELLSLSRGSVGDVPGAGISRYDNALNTCAKRQKSSGVWATGSSGGGRAMFGGGGGQGAWGGKGAWGGRGRGSQGGGGGGGASASPGGGK